jgi:hypothetical protein
MQDMNYQHNPNQHVQQPEVVVSLAEYRLRKLQDAVTNAERSATNELEPITVREVPAPFTQPGYPNNVVDLDSHRQGVAASYETVTPQADQVTANVYKFPNQATPPNTFMIPSSDEAAV